MNQHADFPTPDMARQMANALRMLAVDAIDLVVSKRPGAGISEVAVMLWRFIAAFLLERPP